MWPCFEADRLELSVSDPKSDALPTWLCFVFFYINLKNKLTIIAGLQFSVQIRIH